MHMKPTLPTLYISLPILTKSFPLSPIYSYNSSSYDYILFKKIIISNKYSQTEVGSNVIQIISKKSDFIDLPILNKIKDSKQNEINIKFTRNIICDPEIIGNTITIATIPV
jgi:hypothetical protein